MGSLGRRSRTEQGFTLIELLVVVVIMGILIGIAIPLYLHFKQGAYAATAKADLHTLRLEEQSYNASKSSFASTRQLVSANSSLKLSDGSVGAVIWLNGDAFCVGATNTRGPADSSAPFANIGYPYKTWFFDSTTGNVSTTLCDAPSGATGMDGGYIDDKGGH